VRQFSFVIYLLLIFVVKSGKVRTASAADPPTNLNQPAPTKPSRPTAADILGLNRQRNVGQQKISLEMEVDQYLSNSNEGTGVLEFWQVV
jgi:hypothetical protein